MRSTCIGWILLLVFRAGSLAQTEPADTSLAAEEAQLVALSRAKGYTAAVAVMDQRLAASAAKPPAQKIAQLLAYSNACASMGRYPQAYAYGSKAKAIADGWPARPLETAVTIETQLSTCAQRASNIQLSAQHTRNAYTLLSAAPSVSPERLYRLSNGMGKNMWYASKMDSAAFYFQQALRAVAQIDSTPLNTCYRPALLWNNIAGVYGQQGKHTEAINAMHDVIRLSRLYLASNDTLKKADAAEMELEAFDNLAAIYQTLGDFSRAQHLLEYAFTQKQRLFETGSAPLYKSKVLLGQLYANQHQYDKAEAYLLDGLQAIRNEGGSPNFFEADACNGLAGVYDNTSRPELAKQYFEAADKAYLAAQEGSYDDIYLEFLRRASLFYARNGYYPTATHLSAKADAYIAALPEKQSLLAFHQQLNKASLDQAAKRWASAETNSQRALLLVNRHIASSKNRFDSMLVSAEKPRALAIHAEARYRLLVQKDSNALRSIYEELLEAMLWLEKRKTVLEHQDLNLLLEDHRELNELLKTISLELYRATGAEQWLNRLLLHQESALYTRIRERLDQQAVAFHNVPATVIARETALKKQLLASDDLNSWLTASDNWQAFVSGLEKQYPAYYKMRYASLTSASAPLLDHPPANSSVIRYFFADGSLFALVIEGPDKKLFHLGRPVLLPAIQAISHPATSPVVMSGHLNHLYHSLWAPLTSAVHNRDIILIPDGILYGLPFDLLTPKKFTRFRDMALHSLLSAHAISYRYSLLQNDEAPVASRKANFIAFVPGFGQTTTDTLQRGLDDGYQQLLPLPFTVQLAEKASSWFRGEMIRNEASTSANFIQLAADHRILHIGTHAEFDDLHPAYSRLIFSRGAADTSNNYALYLHQLYNYDLRSDLSVLTACESGRSGYAAGEGMLSMAHAFHYAGSQSMLTGLWKIDDQSSATIIASFYQYIRKGKNKSEALRLAKLDYLATAPERMTTPAYWAGLIINGSNSPLLLAPAGPSSWWWLLLLPAIGYGWLRYAKKRSAPDRQKSLN